MLNIQTCLISLSSFGLIALIQTLEFATVESVRKVVEYIIGTSDAGIVVNGTKELREGQGILCVIQAS